MDRTEGRGWVAFEEAAGEHFANVESALSKRLDRAAEEVKLLNQFVV